MADEIASRFKMLKRYNSGFEREYEIWLHEFGLHLVAY
jgi:hypothetical protein